MMVYNSNNNIDNNESNKNAKVMLTEKYLLMITERKITESISAAFKTLGLFSAFSEYEHNEFQSITIHRLFHISFYLVLPLAEITIILLQDQYE